MRASARDTGRYDASSIGSFGGFDLDTLLDRYVPFSEADALGVTIPTVEDPSLAPPGHDALVVHELIPHGYPCDWEREKSACLDHALRKARAGSAGIDGAGGLLRGRHALDAGAVHPESRGAPRTAGTKPRTCSGSGTGSTTCIWRDTGRRPVVGYWQPPTPGCGSPPGSSRPAHDSTPIGRRGHRRLQRPGDDCRGRHGSAAVTCRP